jgi:phosphatidylserine decarboxylase
VAVIRLAPVDYHRYHFPCDCVQTEQPLVVPGKYHSVNPVALIQKPDVYVANTRQITVLESEKFGSFRYLEVGAFGVGSIIQTSSEGEHRKADEKGFFKFGGSTVILIFDAAKLQWDADLLKNSADGVETLIRCGETIGRSR